MPSLVFMNRLSQNTANRTRSALASWPNSSKAIEPSVERTLTWFEALGYTVLLQSDIISGRHQAILRSYCHGILGERFHQTMQRINPQVSPQQIESILDQLRATRTMPLMQQNRQWHLQLLHGIRINTLLTISNKPITLQLLDFSNLLNNDWLVIYSFPVIEGDYQHCLDLVIFINGLPLVVFQGLHGGEESWSLRAACLRLQEYQVHLPKFFSFNELLVLSNGIQSRIGTLMNDWKQFIPIPAINKEDVPFLGETEIEMLIQGFFDQRRFLQIVQNGIIFRQSRTKLTKKLPKKSV
ncbi:type I restriction endonuclease [Planktothrix mougeotii]|uniref:type I restriction endonuclease n=1 Tax=Planktothrix mougeotii TaxID=54306 RepID=UPI001D14D6B4|nr:type I restriction endonuclease [Planktothrix mougeotii]